MKKIKQLKEILYYKPLNLKIKAEFKELDPTQSMYQNLYFILDIIDFEKCRNNINQQMSQYIIDNNKKMPISTLSTTIANELIKILSSNCTVYKSELYIHNHKKYFKIGSIQLDAQIRPFLTQCVGNQLLDIIHEKTILNYVFASLNKGNDSNHVIQFNDSYLINSKLYKGLYKKSVPNYIINRDAYHLLNANEPKMHPILQDFLLHLNNNDEHTMNYFLNRICMLFLHSNHYMSKRKFIRLYGPSAENGKSVLLSLCKRALGQLNVASMSTSELTGYKLAKVVNALIAIDADSDSAYIEGEAAHNIKKIVTGDLITVRSIYKDPIDVEPKVLLIAASNEMPKSEDKTNGLSRRFEWYEVKNKLVRESGWFNILESEEVAFNFFEILLWRALHLDINEFDIIPQSLIDLSNEFKYENNNILKFIDEHSIESLVNYSTKHCSQLYQNWCELNDETVLGRTKFNQTLRSSGLKVKQIQIKNVNKDDMHIYAQLNLDENINKKIQCWVKDE